MKMRPYAAGKEVDMAIVFDDSLRTGNGLIDTQHQELIARVNKLTDACKVGAEKADRSSDA